MSQSGMVSIFQDFPYSPDMVSEIKVVSSSYDAQYGSTTGGQIVAVTKSGQEKFHGALFEYFQNDSLNANQWGATEKSPLTKHNFGGNIGGPMKIPGLWSNSVKTYFYVDVEGYRQEGGASRPTLSIPSMKQRNGDFSDWRDASGNLIPIYDPATIKPDGSQAAVPGQHHPAEPDHGHRQGIPAVPADAHQRQRAQQLPRAERDPRLHPGRQQLLLRPLRHVHRPEGPRLRLPVAPARRRQVLLGAAAGAGDGVDVGPAELVRGTAQLGPHLRVERAQPPDLRLPEPQRGVRLRQHARGRQAAQDPGGRLEPRPVADELQRRLRRRSAAVAASSRTASPPVRRTSSTTSSPGSRAATRSRSAASTATSAATPTAGRTSRARSTSAAGPPASRARSAATRSRASSSGRWTTPTWTCARRRTPTRGSTPGSSTPATPGTPPAS